MRSADLNGQPSRHKGRSRLPPFLAVAEKSCHPAATPEPSAHYSTPPVAISGIYSRNLFQNYLADGGAKRRGFVSLTKVVVRLPALVFTGSEIPNSSLLTYYFLYT